MTRILITLLLAGLLGTAQAQSFTYRGSLEDGGEPAQGRYQLRISLYADRLGNEALSAPLELNDVTVTDGRFAVGLDFPDLPPGLATGWLEVAVKADDDQWITLDGRSEVGLNNLVCPTPWGLEGNAGTNAAINFLGTTDNQPLELRVANVRGLRIEPSTVLFEGLPITANVIAGSRANEVAAGVRGATLSGGGSPSGSNDPQLGAGPNSITSDYATVGGGSSNLAGSFSGGGTAGTHATVGGGRRNLAGGSDSTVSGGDFNFATGFRSTIGGGANNHASASSATIGGGETNRASESQSTVGGGAFNIASGLQSTVSGGQDNVSSAIRSSVGGGGENSAIGGFSTVSGGFRNCAGGSSSWAGGRRAKIRRGSASGAAGFGCDGVATTGVLGDQGTFVWADSQDADFVSTGQNQFLVRASNGFGLNTNNPTPSHLTIGKNDGSNNVVALGFLGNVTRWRIGGAASAVAGSAFEVQSGGDRVLMRVEDRVSSARVGIFRAPTANALEVNGDASKTTAGSWLANSDARIKTEVHEIDEPLARLMRLRPVSFRYTDDYRAAHPEIRDTHYYNVIAQEFAEVFPEAVKGSGEFLPGAAEDSADEILQVDTYPALITAIAAVQELAVRVEDLTMENAELRAELTVLKLDSSQMQELADRNEALERRLLALESLLLHSGSSMVDSARHQP